MRTISIPILVGTVLVLAVALGALAYVAPWNSAPQGVACTMEAKQCPDGSYVGRVGPNCEFAACPAPSATTSTQTSGAPVAGPGEHCGGFIQNAPVCESGYHCQLKINMPDTGGTCVADNTSGQGIVAYNSGVKGTVMMGPTCPVERMPPDPQCTDKPYKTAVVVFRASDPAHPFAIGTSDANGAFAFSLPPGDYTLGAGESNLPRCDHPSATVAASGYTTVNISCDTGIR